VKRMAIVLIVVSLAVLAWFTLRPQEDEAPPITRADVTLRSTGAGDLVGFIGAYGARSWLGIPYAEPPTGDRRWRAPEPPAPWSGTREALAPGSPCPQYQSPLSGADARGGASKAIIGSEDCLYLNVWAPANARALPVMLWIHGGGNSIGTGASYDGARLAVEQQLVVVTINYRLGPLGWFAHPELATGDPLDDSGNYGNLDTLRALAWVRGNIGAFGGDPDNITVFGESAGATDTLALMASPLAAGQFHRAIVQSGGYRPTPMKAAQALQRDGGHRASAREITARLMVADGTAADPDAARDAQAELTGKRLRDYLYGKSAAEILGVFDNAGIGMIDSPAVFADGHVLPEGSADTVFGDTDRFNAVPVILGSNRDEPALFMALDPRHTDTTLWIFRRLEDPEGYRREVEYGALAWKARGVDELAELMTGAGHEDVWAYRFDWDELGSLLGFDLKTALGAAHGLEIPFVFGDFEGGLRLAYLYDGTAAAREPLVARIMNYWAAFARDGDPGRGRDGKGTLWQRWGSDGRTTLLLDDPADPGIRMTDELVTSEAVVARLAADPAVPSQRERCALYVRSFRWGDRFDRETYENLGAKGCAPFEPESFMD